MDFAERDNRRSSVAVGNTGADRRSEGRHDRDRIYYSAGLMRLARVTQVITPTPEGALIHNRLTHSLRVAQLARSLAENLLRNEDNHELLSHLGGLDADVAEAAGLAHDIGHPPFGHAGEHVLDEIARNFLRLPDGFEGNAQTFRIVTKIERRNPSYDGMDLTRATRAALLKYPWVRLRSPRASSPGDHLEARKWLKFNAYDSENGDLGDARTFLPSNFPHETQSLEASIMDVSDDIAYAVHDLEDFILARIVDLRSVRDDLDMLANGVDGPRFAKAVKDWDQKYPGYFEVDMMREGAKVLFHTLAILDRRFDGSSDDTAAVHALCSRLIDKYIGRVRLPLNQANPEPHWHGGPYIALDEAAWHEVQILKHITRAEVVDRSDVALLQRGQQELLRNLVERLHAWTGSNDFHRLPPRLREYIDLARAVEGGSIAVGYRAPDHPFRGMTERAILDYLCTLTDGQCRQLYQLLCGATAPAITGAFSV